MSEALHGLTRRQLMRVPAAFAAASTAPGLLSAPAFAQGVSGLPARGEFVIRGASILTMESALGDIPRGDIHARDGAIVADAAETMLRVRAGVEKVLREGGVSVAR